MMQRISDVGTMVGRLMRHSMREVDTLITTAVLPIILMLLFVFVFGGAIETSATSYVQYVVPGILLLAIGYGAASTAVSVASDIKKGIIDRFNTMPIARSTVLTSHVVASVLRNVVTAAIVLGVGYALGFRAEAGIAGWLAAVGLLTLYATAMTWVSVVFGLMASSPEGASGFSFAILFLPYLSSTFVPTGTMPLALRVFSDNQPITPINEALRSFLSNVPAGNTAWIALAWCGGIIAAAYAISMWLYRKKTA